MSIQRDGDNLVAYVYQDEPLSDGDRKSVTERIDELVWEEEENEDDEDD